METKPGPQHEWLQKLVGEWTSEAEADMEPGKPKVKIVGTESVRSIGGLWILGEGHSSMPGGGDGTMFLTLGFDPAKGFVGTWIGSMMANLWIYSGELDPGGKKLYLNSEGPDFETPGKTRRYRETIELLSDDERTFSSAMLNGEGTWTTFMTARYRRVK